MTVPTLTASTMSTTEPTPPSHEPVRLPACESCEQNAATVRVIWPDESCEQNAATVRVIWPDTEFLVCSDPGCCPPGLLVLQLEAEGTSS